VLDASVALSWCFADEHNGYGVRVLDLIETADAIVPAIWPLEVVNAVVIAERKGRLKQAESSRFLELISSVRINVDAQTPSQALGAALALARRHDLSVYDAAYLELAIRESAPVATLDRALERAARKVHLPRLDL
jgi:predicted nucleic acid-binding protein